MRSRTGLVLLVVGLAVTLLAGGIAVLSWQAAMVDIPACRTDPDGSMHC